MYPEISLVNKNKSKLVVFERDFNNPFNEGFIIYWEIIKSENKQLIFKKRLTTIRAQKKLAKGIKWDLRSWCWWYPLRA